MSEIYLQREAAPFSGEVWNQIDAVVLEAARSQLCSRRLLAVEGPLGLGLKSISNKDSQIKTKDDVTVMLSSSLPLAMIQKNFVLGVRDIAAFECDRIAIDLGAAVTAAHVCARQENEFIFSGLKGHFQGLFNVPGVQICKIKIWNEVGRAVEDVIQSVNMLDAAGFHGPFSLGLKPDSYNSLFHRYQQGNTTEIEHLKELISGGIFKMPGLPSAGILAACGKQFASILLGQDLMTGFVGSVTGGYEFSMTESFILRMLAPEAFCIMKAG